MPVNAIGLKNAFVFQAFLHMMRIIYQELAIGISILHYLYSCRKYAKQAGINEDEYNRMFSVIN